MNEERTIVPTASVGRFARAEEFGDRFVAGLVYCTLIENMAEQQVAITDVLQNGGSVAECLEAKNLDIQLQMAWSQLGETFGFDA
jgi:hypothetical protein